MSGGVKAEVSMAGKKCDVLDLTTDPDLTTATRTTRTALAKQCGHVLFHLMTALLSDGNSTSN